MMIWELTNVDSLDSFASESLIKKFIDDKFARRI